MEIEITSRSQDISAPVTDGDRNHKSVTGHKRSRDRSAAVACPHAALRAEARRPGRLQRPAGPVACRERARRGPLATGRVWTALISSLRHGVTLRHVWAGLVSRPPSSQGRPRLKAALVSRPPSSQGRPRLKAALVSRSPSSQGRPAPSSPTMRRAAARQPHPHSRLPRLPPPRSTTPQAALQQRGGAPRRLSQQVRLHDNTML
jgi:hypothetical protein